MYRIEVFAQQLPWWIRLVLWLTRSASLRLTPGKHFKILIFQDKVAGLKYPLSHGPMMIDGYVGEKNVSTKVGYPESVRLVRRTER